VRTDVRPPVLSYAAALLAVTVAFSARAALAPWLGHQVPFLLFYPAFVVAAWLGGLGPGLLATAVGGAVALFVYRAPAGAVAPTFGASVSVFNYFLIGTMVSVVCEQLHRARRRAEQCAAEAERCAADAQRSSAEAGAERARAADILESVTDAFYALDHDWRYTYVNRRCEQYYGKPRSELLGRTVWEVFPSAVGTAFDRVPPGRPGPGRGRLRGRLPARRPVGRGPRLPVGRRAVGLPPRRPRAEGGRGGPGGVRAAAGRHPRQRPRRRPAEGPGRPVPDGQPPVRAAVRRRPGGGGRQDGPRRLPAGDRRRAGRQRPRRAGRRDRPGAGGADPGPGDGTHTYLAVKFPLRDAAGAPYALCAIAKDITLRKRAETALAASEARKAAVLRAALDCIITVDHAGRVVEWNPAAEQTFGHPREHAVGRDVVELVFPPAGRAGHQAALARWVRTGHSPLDGKRVEVTAARADGAEFPAELAMVRIPTGDDLPLFTGYLRDITAVKRAETRRARADADRARADGEREAAAAEREQLLAGAQAARAEAERASRAKDQFLAVLSHELRTPLTPVLAAVAHLSAAPDLPPAVRENLSTIRRNVQMEARLIDDLLDLTRIARGKIELHLEVTDAHAVAREAARVSQPEADAKGVTLDVRLDAARHHVWADPARLQQVVWNLLSNAVKFTPPGGRVTLRTTDDHGEADARREAVARQRAQRLRRGSPPRTGPAPPPTRRRPRSDGGVRHRRRDRPRRDRPDLRRVRAGRADDRPAVRRARSGARHRPDAGPDARRHPDRPQPRAGPRRDVRARTAARRRPRRRVRPRRPTAAVRRGRDDPVVGDGDHPGCRPPAAVGRGPRRHAGRDQQAAAVQRVRRDDGRVRGRRDRLPGVGRVRPGRQRHRAAGRERDGRDGGRPGAGRAGRGPERVRDRRRRRPQPGRRGSPST
jgi:PAS domain S-box-containing protein